MTDASIATEQKQPEKKGKAKRKQPTVRQDLAKLRKQVKELTVRLVALESGTAVKPVEQASIDKSGEITGEKSTLRSGTNMEMTDFDLVRSVINAASVLPSTARDGASLMHTLENLSALCGCKVTDEIREAAYSDEKFKMHLKEFGLTRTIDLP